MADRAQVTSLEAIEAFRSQLIIYLSKARPTLEEVSTNVMRTRQWLQTDHRRFWELQLLERKKKLERAQNELFTATLSQFSEACAIQQLAVRRAQEAVREAEAKLALLQKWDRELEHRAEPLVKQVEQLHHFLTSEAPKAIAYLTQMIQTLESYAGIHAAAPGATRAESPAAPEPGGSKTEPSADGTGGKP
jgi:hypothetical protein